MERASAKCFEWIRDHIDQGTLLHIVCGTGNNGGDGLAIGRMLLEDGHDVRFWIVNLGDKPSADFTTNRKRLLGEYLNEYPDRWHEDETPDIKENEVIIDAIFGTGISRPASELPLEFIQAMNSSGGYIISIDMPSGLTSDANDYNADYKCTKSNITLTFQTYKSSMLLPASGRYCGQIMVFDIGLDPETMSSLVTKEFVPEASDIKDLLRKRPLFSHKGNYGHALLMTGSEGMTGASVLATSAALRSGSGLVTSHLPGSCKVPVRVNCPEAMTSTDTSETHITERPELSKFDSIGFGPGTGTSEETASVLKGIIQDCGGNLVIDADGLNILAMNPTWLAFLPPHTILTPHPGEFERLSGKWENDFERNRLLKDVAAKTNCIIILKGHFTAIADPNGMIFYSPVGNPGMAKGGSGDVLTGLITGLLARGLKPLEAAIAGVYIHGLAGDHAAEDLGMECMTSLDLIRFLPDAFRQVENR
jgi:NAD(P)H-hydrate epimerase